MSSDADLDLLFTFASASHDDIDLAFDLANDNRHDNSVNQDDIDLVFDLADNSRDTSAPQDDIDQVFDLAAQPPAEPKKNNIKGTVLAGEHARTMRNKKEAKMWKQIRNKYTEQEKKKAANLNRYAVRPRQELNFEGPLKNKKEAKIKGRGSYKVWSSSSLLRACFGFAKVQKKAPGKPPRKRSAGWTENFKILSQSQRGTAYWFSSAHTYLSKVRKAVAMRMRSRQIQKLKTTFQARHTVLQLATDDTEFELAIHQKCEVSNVCMIHCRHFARTHSRGRRRGRRRSSSNSS